MMGAMSVMMGQVKKNAVGAQKKDIYSTLERFRKASQRNSLKLKPRGREINQGKGAKERGEKYPQQYAEFEKGSDSI